MELSRSLVLQVHDELCRLLRRLERLRLVHEAAQHDPQLQATIAARAARQGAGHESGHAQTSRPASAPVRTLSRRVVAKPWFPGIAFDEIKMSHTSVSNAQVAALVLLMTRPEHEKQRASVRRLLLDGNDMMDKQFVMLLRGMHGLGQIKHLSAAHNKLTRTSVVLLARYVHQNATKHVRICVPCGM
jgi:hypothetical protein